MVEGNIIMIYWKIIKFRFWFWAFCKASDLQEYLDAKSEYYFQSEDKDIQRYIDDWSEYNGN